MSNPTTISGMLDAKGLKIAILATRFNDFIVDRLTGGALDYLERHGLDAKNITIVRIPGAFEMPLVCQKLAASGKYDGIVALGAVIRGATPHFDYVCNEASKGIAQVMLQYKTPIGFGLAWAIQWNDSFLFFTGAVLGWAADHLFKAKSREYKVPTASGIIAGAALTGMTILMFSIYQAAL